MVTMEHYLIVSSIMFFVGVYGFITRKNLLCVQPFSLSGTYGRYVFQPVWDSDFRGRNSRGDSNYYKRLSHSK